MPANLAESRNSSITLVAISLGSVNSTLAVRPLAKSRNSFTNAEIRSMFSSTTPQPRRIRAESAFFMPVRTM